MRRFSFLLIALAACAPEESEKPAREPRPDVVDADGDGFLSDEDCDDSRADVSPAASERCDGVDGDCDGLVDDAATDAPAWYADVDGDGFGAGAPTAACAAPAGTVARAGDCDDVRADVFPGAPEACDTVDSDCDGSLSDPEATDASLWYADADGDGFGDAAAGVAACEAPPGAVADATDCDDTRADVSPGAAETCDRVDDDCDGLVDEGFDADADGIASCAGDCDDDVPSVYPGAVEACDTFDNDCNGVADDGAGCPCAVEYWPDTLHPYLYCEATTDWYTADATCAALGYRLVTFDSAAEGTWVEATVAGYAENYWWVGFTDASSEGSWSWTDGSPTTYLNWNSGEPNNGHGHECVATSEEDCAMIRWSGSAWNDYPCACSWPSYVCEGLSEYRPQE
jgi:hypothetical protein